MRFSYARIARALAAAALLTGLATSVVQTQPAQASVSYGNAALNWAEAHATGHWYGWGGTGPSVYDCSGLVYASMLHTNPHWPSSARTTYAMIAWLYGHAHQIPLSQVQRGDLLFFGSGHVEYATIWHHVSFGAHHTGTTVGWSHYDPRYWGPTMAFRVW
jgi:cell wall-associated NlpC family hydrolase